MKCIFMELLRANNKLVRTFLRGKWMESKETLYWVGRCWSIRTRKKGNRTRREVTLKLNQTNRATTLLIWILNRLLLERGYTVDIAYTSMLKRAIRSSWIILNEINQIYRPTIKSWRLNERMYVIHFWNSDLTLFSILHFPIHGKSLYNFYRCH